MKVLFIISTADGETIFNAMRLANVGIKNRATNLTGLLRSISLSVAF